MENPGSYKINSVSRDVNLEIQRLKGQVDLFWSEELIHYKALGLKDGMTVVELGCGPGHLTGKILEVFPESCVFGVENDPLLVEFAKKQIGETFQNRLHLIRSSISATGLRDNLFDFAISRLVLEHLPDPLGAIREVFRILKPHGRAVFLNNDFEMHLITHPHIPDIPELRELYDAYCRCRISEGGTPTIGRQLPVLLRKAGFLKVDMKIISAHNELAGDKAFLASEGIGIPMQLVNDGFLKAETLSKIAVKWRKMLRDEDHAISRQLFMAVGEKPERFPEEMKTADSSAIVEVAKREPAYVAPEVVSEERAVGVDSPLDRMELRLKEILARVLNNVENADESYCFAPDSPELNASFVELGLNSIALVDLIELINETLSLDIEVDVIFDCQGVRELALRIIQDDEAECRLKYSEEKPGEDAENFALFSKQERRHGDLRMNSSSRASQKCGAVAGPNSGIKTVFRRRRSDSPVAVVGLSGRFAGAGSVDELWQNLVQGRCLVKEIDREGWEVSEFFDPDPSAPDKSISKWGGLIEDFDRFDPLFFNISPREALMMEPRQRLFLTECFKAFENAGYAMAKVSEKKIGVFAGIRTSGFTQALLQQGVNSRTLLGGDMSILPARISYFFDMKGPSMAVDTACSSALSAIHLAVASIRRGESEMALAGGAFIMNSPEYYILASKSNILSPVGQCRIFDKRVDGFVPGEGVGVAVLKSLQEAIKDGDHIYGVIRGSEINHDGRTHGIMAPSPDAQRALVRKAHENAGVDPVSIGYIEVNGVGAKMGDLVEIKALSQVFSAATKKKQVCVIGSLKPNIGHTLTASGMAGLFKILLMFKHGVIPPTIGFEEINEKLDLENSPFMLNPRQMPWESKNGAPRRAGISAFGLGGTNCHLVIEEAPARPETSEPAKPFYLAPLSARSEAALSQKVVDLSNWLDREKGYSIRDVTRTLQMGRTHFPVRIALIVRDVEDLKKELDAIRSGRPVKNCRRSESDTPAPGPNSGHEARAAECLNALATDSVKTPDAYRKTMSELARLYAMGLSIEWERMDKKKEGRACHYPPTLLSMRNA